MIRNIAKSSLAAFALLGFLGATVSAAELVKLEGKVSVNRGDGFEPAKLGMVLKPGDQVLVGEKSAASLVYSEPGCVFEVAPASVTTVSDVGPCVPGETVAQGRSALVTPTQADPDPDLTPFYVMGGFAVIGAGAFIIAESNNDEDEFSGGGGIGGGGPNQPGPNSPF